ncbi:MAG: hypothetical protein RR620_11985 [Clostridium sp.]
MDEIKRLYAGKITNVETQVFDLTNGAVLKSILISNLTSVESEVILKIDAEEFIFTVQAKKTLIVDNPIVCNIFKVHSIGETVLSIHVSGIQLGGA